MSQQVHNTSDSFSLFLCFIFLVGQEKYPLLAHTPINTSTYAHRPTYNKAASGGPLRLPIIRHKYSPLSQAGLHFNQDTHTYTHPVTLAALVQAAFYPCLFRCTRGHNGGALAALGLTAAVISLWLPHASYLTLNSLSGMRAK